MLTIPDKAACTSISAVTLVPLTPKCYRPIGPRQMLCTRWVYKCCAVLSCSVVFPYFRAQNALVFMVCEVLLFPRSPSGTDSCVCVCVRARVHAHVLCSVAQLCPTLCYSMCCSLPSSSVHEIFLAGILEWIAISSSRGSSWPRDWTHFFCASYLGSRSLSYLGISYMHCN